MKKMYFIFVSKGTFIIRSSVLAKKNIVMFDKCLKDLKQKMHFYKFYS